MITPLNEYYERIRNKKNFLATLIFGIIGAGVITLYIEFLIDSLKNSALWVYIPWILLFIFSIFIYLALILSQQTEKIVTTYYISINPKSFESLILTTLNEIPEDSPYKRELHSTLNDISKILNDPILSENSNISSIRPYSEKLLIISHQIENITVKRFVSTIQENLSDLDSLSDELSNYIKNKTNIFKQDYTVNNFNKGVVLKKRFSLNIILKISFESNLTKSLLYPVVCRTERSPFLAVSEYTLLLEKIHEVFTEIALKDKFLKLGVKFNEIEDIKYWDRFHKTFHKPVMNELKTSLEFLDKVNISIEKISKQLPEEKSK